MQPTCSLTNRIIKIKNDLIQFKTSQPTQNDSYTLYAYRTDNLAGSARTFRVEFEPYKKDTSTLCRMLVFGGNTGTSSYALANGGCSPDNPLTFYVNVGSSSGYDIFVWVVSNKSGILKVTQIG